MNAQPKRLRLAKSQNDPVSRQQIAMAAIHQSWREWRRDYPWSPFSEPQSRPTLDESVSQQATRIADGTPFLGPLDRLVQKFKRWL